MDCINEVTDVVYAESRGEHTTGNLAVIHVINNRANKYNKSPCYIVVQKSQFTKGKRNVKDKVWHKIRELVKNPGKDITNGALFFHNLSVKPNWNLKVTFRFGNHIFYK